MQNVAAQSARPPAPRRERLKEFYLYESGTAFLPIALSAANIDDAVQVQADAHFIIGRTMYRADSNATGTIQNNPGLTAQWINVSGKIYMNLRNVPCDNLYGTAQRPHILQMMLAVPANTIFTVRLTNLTAAAIFVFLTHEGYKEYLYEYAD